jgi:hypothetical protein
MHHLLRSGLGGRKAPSSMGKASVAEVLRLRATSAVSRDQSVRRFAQDDNSVGEPAERRASCGSRGALQVPRLRFAPVGMTSGGWWLLLGAVRLDGQKNTAVPPLRFGSTARRDGRDDNSFLKHNDLTGKSIKSQPMQFQLRTQRM